MVRTKGVSRQVWAIQKRDGSIDLACRRIEGNKGQVAGLNAERVLSAMAMTDMGCRLRNASGAMFGPLWLTKTEAQRHCATWEQVVQVRVIAPDLPSRIKEGPVCPDCGFVMGETETRMPLHGCAERASLRDQGLVP